ncbi:MAG: adenylate class-3/4/guanylyl cyclase [Rhizobiales bacterium]|nr:adenylate class-3/4/guanylyl cyclase [Hyphomicrobiales bacterium]
MVADVVGYSRMMEQDEAGTLAALKERRKAILEPVVKEHGGRIVKVMGDGALVEFGSAVNAVQGAIELQKKMAAANEGVDEAKRIVLRIGINLGDVIGEGSDTYGEGVNIAARLEPIAEPGGIAFSRAVQEQIVNKVGIVTDDMGEQQLKNIGQPIRVFRARPALDMSAPKSNLPTADKPSIAVLPFQNMSGDPEQAYFADGITEDIITELSRFRTLWVISRSSSFTYKGRSVKIADVARDLRASHVLEGSVRRTASRLRITAQLIDAKTGSHIWAERYDRAAEELFAVQDELIRTIAGTLAGRVISERLDGNRRRPATTLAAYDCVLRGRSLPWGDSDADLEARRLYEKAVTLDPGYALAHALLALSMYGEWNSTPGASPEVLYQAWKTALKAVTLDPGEDMAYDTLGYIELFRRNYEAAEEHSRRAIAINSNDPEHVAGLGSVVSYAGRTDEGLRLFRQAQEIDPYFAPSWYWYLLCEAYYAAGDYESAIAVGQRVGAQAPRLLVRLAACHAHAGREGAARELVSAALGRQPGLSISFMADRTPFRLASDIDRFNSDLRRAGLPE